MESISFRIESVDDGADELDSVTEHPSLEKIGREISRAQLYKEVLKYILGHGSHQRSAVLWKGHTAANSECLVSAAAQGIIYSQQVQFQEVRVPSKNLIEPGKEGREEQRSTKMGLKL